MTRLSGGLIDRNRSLNFSFDGKSYTGHAGDTLASALLANDVRLMGRGFKYHRPRGVFTAGSEEPNALVELRSGARQEPNTRATVAELFEGLDARSQNHVGPLSFDLLAVNDLMSPFFAAGFYYKTFMWPKAFWEKLYEPMIRRAAGLGSLSMQADPDSYDAGFLHCDLLVIGGGAAGLAAALTAARTGARVILADEDFRLGGRLLAESAPLDRPATEWIAEVEAEFASLPNLRVMRRTTVWGAFDHGIYGAVERVSDHLPTPGKRVRQSLWRITAKRAILAAGATERHIPFANNDRPGVMMAGAMRAYANRWAVSPAKRVAIFTNNDDGHRTAADLAAKGVEIAAVVDSRPDAPARGSYRTIAGGMVTDSKGRLGLSKIEVTQNGRAEWIDCGALGVSGGWNPNLHIASHHRGRPVWNEAAQAFLAEDGNVAGLSIAGAAAGKGSTAQALASGAQAAVAALADIGIGAHLPDLPRAEDEGLNLKPLWHVPGKGRAWVDFQNDVTVKDVKLAYVENMRPVEHLKRWTTLGMATDQGKTSNVTAIAVMAELTGQSLGQTGTTIFRPPYTPVSMSVLGGGDTGAHFRPRRLTPTHEWAKSQGAVFVEVGQWMRAQYFPRKGETTWRQTVDREVLATRAGVGICDVTTLGKVDVQLISTTDAWAQLSVAGPHARKLLERVVDGFDISNEGFPFMACTNLTVCGGLRARLFRISFSGELAYEIAVPARYGNALMARMMQVGADLGATPYGTETLGVLRIEKGHAAGNELNGQTTAQMLGMGKMVSTRKDSIGAVLSRREGLVADRRVLVGFQPVNAADPVMAGAHLFAEGAAQDTANDQGWITSACYSPHVGSAIGLGYLVNGDSRKGEVVVAANPLQGQSVRVRVVSAHFVDPEGGRVRD